MCHEKCITCGILLYPEDDTHDQDEAYCIDGHVLCEECVGKFVKDNYKHEIKNGGIQE